jgi:hypothetical protein
MIALNSVQNFCSNQSQQSLRSPEPDCLQQIVILYSFTLRFCDSQTLSLQFVAAYQESTKFFRPLRTRGFCLRYMGISIIILANAIAAVSAQFAYLFVVKSKTAPSV